MIAIRAPVFCFNEISSMGDAHELMLICVGKISKPPASRPVELSRCRVTADLHHRDRILLEVLGTLLPRKLYFRLGHSR